MHPRLFFAFLCELPSSAREGGSLTTNALAVLLVAHQAETRAYSQYLCF